MDNDKNIEFVPNGQGKARCAPNPLYPEGIAIPMPPGCEAACLISLPYPAPECGMWEVTCATCGMCVLISAAGRPDDPISFYMPCESKGEA